VRRRGSFELRVFGRFKTENRATITFRYVRRPKRRHHLCDDSGRNSLSPMRVRRFPFRDCRTHRAKTVLSAPTGRVFWQPAWKDEWRTVAYACLFSANKRFRLAGWDEDDDSDLELFRLVGPYVAYMHDGCAETCTFGMWVRVHDLRTGAQTRHEANATDLELKENGSTAWIDHGDPYAPDPHPVDVWAADSLGVRRLDHGSISGRSLTLKRSTLSWLKDGGGCAQRPSTDAPFERTPRFPGERPTVPRLAAPRSHRAAGVGAGRFAIRGRGGCGSAVVKAR
jgi:hypothetical protein